MNIDRRKLLKGPLVSATALSLLADPAAAALKAIQTASHGSERIRALLERARLTEPKVRSVNRAKISNYIADDYRLANESIPEIVWFENLETFALRLLRSPILIDDRDGLKSRTLVGGHFTWSGSSRYWQKFAQSNKSYDWRRYPLFYNIITNYLWHDCADSVEARAQVVLDKIVNDSQWRGVFADDAISCARNAIGSISTAGIVYAYAISLIDAAFLAGVNEVDPIISEMMMPIEAYESGFWFALVTADKLLCVERPKYI